MESLHQIWTSIFSGSNTDEQLLKQFWNEMCNAYASNNLAYHNIQHLQHMFTTYKELNFSSENEDVLFLAIFFHDVVYDPRQKDNEYKSAEKARTTLTALNFPSHKIEWCVQHILATENHEATEHVDTQILLDLDLSILGSDRDTYSQYAQNIRKEYSMFNDLDYQKGRIKALQHLIELPHLYQTEAARAYFYDNAIKNLNWELNLWKTDILSSSSLN